MHLKYHVQSSEYKYLLLGLDHWMYDSGGKNENEQDWV